jgi:tRNA threonylcarbamoyladenosine biosynthesis protein TsaB
VLRLALETSTSLGSVALADGEQLLAESTLSVQASHSEALMPEIQRLLNRSDVAPESLGAVVVGAGPGSFTGVRIAASVAKGYSFATGVPLYAYSSLLAVAASSGSERVCAMFDARRGEVYAAAYRRTDPLECVFPPIAQSVESVLARVEKPSAWHFAGEGAIRYADRIARVGGRVLPAHLGVPRASALLWLASRWPDKGRVRDSADWEPEYVRASGARRAAERAAAEDTASV